MENISRILINKNRGWRGLTEINCLDSENNQVLNMIFSFSQPVWDDLMYLGRIVVQDKDNYYILTLNSDDADRLPIGHQRSVLIKNFLANVHEIVRVSKVTWTSAEGEDWALINHFKKNTNNHTTSDWNCIGIRVTPEI